MPLVNVDAKSLEWVTYLYLSQDKTGIEEWHNVVNDPTKFDSNLLVSKTLTIIDQSRNNLTDFKTNKADSIPQYLDKYFSPEHIGQKIEEALDIVANEPDIAVAQQNIFHLIQSVQSALLRKLNTAIEEGNFPKQELRQATT